MFRVDFSTSKATHGRFDFNSTSALFCIIFALVVTPRKLITGNDQNIRSILETKAIYSFFGRGTTDGLWRSSLHGEAATRDHKHWMSLLKNGKDISKYSLTSIQHQWQIMAWTELHLAGWSALLRRTFKKSHCSIWNGKFHSTRKVFSSPWLSICLTTFSLVPTFSALELLLSLMHPHPALITLGAPARTSGVHCCQKRPENCIQLDSYFK